MAFNVQQNNTRDNKVSVNTRGYQFFNLEGFGESTLTIGYWNDFMSIRMNPALDKSQRSENRVYDYDKTVSTALSIRVLARLCKGIKDYILPAIESGEDSSVSVQVGGDSLITVGTGTKYTKTPCQYIAIHKELDEATKKPQMSIFYEFAKDSIIKEYDEKTGSYDIVNDVNDEFYLFVEMLKSSLEGFSKINAHVMRHVDKFNTDRLHNNINAIADKVGAKTMTSGGNGYSTRNYVNFNNRESDTGMEYTNLSDLESLGE